MARILIVEDETDLASLLEYNLLAEGYEVEKASTGTAALACANATSLDLVLLDMMLPDISGTDVLRMLRSASKAPNRLPVIMVTAKGEESDRIRGLELGADDYVVKPFSVKELMLRVKSVLRRLDAGVPQEETLVSGEIELDAVRHQVRINHQGVTLTALEFRLLKTFLERPDRVQSREKLLSDVWGIEADITTRTVDTHIKRLREKMGPSGDRIETIRGVGYKFT